MCGITAIIHNSNISDSKQKILKMNSALLHRGPDDCGYFHDDLISLGHRRLSIIDLSKSGKQPMFYENLVITFNGEIYNYIELKNKLISKGYVFSSNSDTEVLLILYKEYKEKCLHMIDGMFSFIIYDLKLKELFIARDRLGEKPLFYTKQNDVYYFSSEIKSLKEIFKFQKNESLVYNFYFQGFERNPHDLSETFYKDIFQIPPSTYATINNNNSLQKFKYWDIDLSIKRDLSFDEVNKKFENLIDESVERRLRSDVKVGTSLSGGLDSSLLSYSIFKKNNSQNFKTFSAVFPGYNKDESRYINIVNNHFNFKSVLVKPLASDFSIDFGKILQIQDEPFISSSIYAQYLVMKEAKKNNVKVLIDGQGADEIFCGYTGLADYFFIEKFRENIFVGLSQFYKSIIKNTNNKFNKNSKRIPALFLKSLLSETQINSFNNSFKLINSNKIVKEYFYDNKNLTYKVDKFKTLNDALYFYTFKGPLQNLLRYCDRNSMANSIEVRLPYLNHKLIEFAFCIDNDYKFNDGFSKVLLRDYATKGLPHQITHRIDKIGYATPQQKFLESFTQFNDFKNFRWKHLLLNELKLW